MTPYHPTFAEWVHLWLTAHVQGVTGDGVITAGARTTGRGLRLYVNGAYAKSAEKHFLATWKSKQDLIRVQVAYWTNIGYSISFEDFDFVLKPLPS